MIKVSSAIKLNMPLCGGDAGMIKVSSAIKLNMPKIKQLTQAQVTALEQTAEALHTEVVLEVMLV